MFTLLDDCSIKDNKSTVHKKTKAASLKIEAAFLNTQWYLLQGKFPAHCLHLTRDGLVHNPRVDFSCHNA